MTDGLKWLKVVAKKVLNSSNLPLADFECLRIKY